MVGRLGMVVPVLPAWIFGGDGAGRVVARVAACRGAALGGVLVTVPPPPAVPGEWEPWVEKAGIAVADYLIRQPWDTSLTTLRMSHGEEIAGAVLRAVYGDIAEAARRPLLAEVERLRAALDKAREIIGEKIAARFAAEREWAEEADRAVEAARRDALTTAVERAAETAARIPSPFADNVVSALRGLLRDGNAPRDGLSATGADQTPVPRTPRTDGAQIAVQGREGER